MSQKICRGMRVFHELLEINHVAIVSIDFRQGVNNECIGTARVYDSEKWVDIHSIKGYISEITDKHFMRNKLLIYIVNQLSFIAMENNGVSFTSVYNADSFRMQQLVSQGVLVSNNKNTEYTVSTTNDDIDIPMINYLFDLLGYRIRYQSNCFYIGRAGHPYTEEFEKLACGR